ncbi:uncharacterized protein LOC134837447 [Culicoides brevitarsis]|uniref:uncharacterized protein LOC134837447 n=1 Tax=Culicoides brevitarsis TaxID=469753 RepID=UPI00307B5005
MKCFTIILIVAAAIQIVVGSDEIKKMLMEVGMKCGAEHGVTDEMFKQFAGGDSSSFDAQKKCAAKCFFVNIGMADTSMNLNEDKMKEFLGAAPAEMQTALADCAKLSAAEPCEKAFKIMECVMKAEKNA